MHDIETLDRNEDGIAVHILDDLDPYGLTQTRDEIKDGDVLVIASSGTIGFLFQAWPVKLVGDESTGFHDVMPIPPDRRDDQEHPLVGYRKSVLAALAVADADADVTGNRDWPEDIRANLRRLNFELPA